jgi:hypothetical protein
MAAAPCTLNELRAGLLSHLAEPRQDHFLTEGFSNDFAQWVLAGLNRPQLAKRLAARKGGVSRGI